MRWDFAALEQGNVSPEDEAILQQMNAKQSTGGGAADPAAIGFHGHAKLFADMIRALVTEAGYATLRTGVDTNGYAYALMASYDGATGADGDFRFYAATNPAVAAPLSIQTTGGIVRIYSEETVDRLIAEAIADYARTNSGSGGYATTNDIAAMHPPFQEWVSATHDRIAASAIPASAVSTPRLDAAASVGVASGYALRALRSYRSGDMVSETDIEGEWALVAETDSAVLTSNVLQNTTRSGLATVEFTPADGSDTLRTSVSMPGDAKRTTTTWPAREVSGNWRKSAVYPPYEFDGTVLRVNTNTWNGSTYICTNYSEATPWLGVTTPNPAFVGTPPLWYAARRRANGSDMGGGLVGIAPHYALCAAHCGHTYSSTWITNYAAGLAVTTARGSKVDEWGDLRLVRLPDPGVPAQCRAKLLRASVLKEKSSSMLFRDLGVAWTQHGFFAACLLEPRNGGQTDLSGYSWDRGWTYVGARDEWRNTTWGVDEMANTLSHDAHAGDSGHPCFFTVNGHCIPVGVFHWANGSGECLLSDAMLDKIDDAVRRDSGGTETLDYLTAEDLEQQQP